MDAYRAKEAWRVFRIQSELVNGIEHLANLGPSVTIYGSARLGPESEYYEKARILARRFGEAGLNVLTGGGPGIMQGANEGAYDSPSCSIGLNIELPFEEQANRYQNLSLNFRYFFIRKLMFVKHAQGFVVFPGGMGTMDELFEALTLLQTRKIKGFPVVLIGTSFWSGLVDWLKNTMLAQGCISESDLSLFHVTDSVDEAFEHVYQHFTCQTSADDNLLEPVSVWGM